METTHPTSRFKSTGSGDAAATERARGVGRPAPWIESHLDAGEGQLAARALLAA